jgi:hypothetical protein
MGDKAEEKPEQMEPITVTTQAEYDMALSSLKKNQPKRYFDIEAGMGIPIIKEVDWCINQYLYFNEPREAINKDLSRLYFTDEQAELITGYFMIHRPDGGYEIERGLNALGVIPKNEIGNTSSPIIIKEATEKIFVTSPVEVFDIAAVEALEDTTIIARDDSLITARGQTIVKAYNNASINAYENSFISLYDDSTAIAFGDGAVLAHDDAHVTAKYCSIVLAGDRAFVTAIDSSTIKATNDAVVIAFNNADVTGHENTLILAEDTVKAFVDDTVGFIRGKENTPKLLRHNMLTILYHPFIEGDPMAAVTTLLKATRGNKREAFSKMFKAMGCRDGIATRQYINNLVKDVDTKNLLKRERTLWDR